MFCRGYLGFCTSVVFGPGVDLSSLGAARWRRQGVAARTGACFSTDVHKPAIACIIGLMMVKPQKLTDTYFGLQERFL